MASPSVAFTRPFSSETAGQTSPGPLQNADVAQQHLARERSARRLQSAVRSRIARLSLTTRRLASEGTAVTWGELEVTTAHQHAMGRHISARAQAFLRLVDESLAPQATSEEAPVNNMAAAHGTRGMLPLRVAVKLKLRAWPRASKNRAAADSSSSIGTDGSEAGTCATLSGCSTPARLPSTAQTSPDGTAPAGDVEPEAALAAA